MKLSDINTLNKTLCLLEKSLSLTINTYYYIDTNKTIGDEALHHGDLVSIELSVISTSHEAKHLIRTGLEWNVEMWHELRATRGAMAYYIISQQVRLNARNPVSSDSLHFLKSLNKLEESLTVMPSEISYIHTCQDNLLGPVRNRPLSQFDRLGNCATPA